MMETYHDKEDRAKDRTWKTAFVIVQDEEGQVFVDNSLRHFKDQLQRQATAEDTIYMLKIALIEFEAERITRIAVNELMRILRPKKEA